MGFKENADNVLDSVERTTQGGGCGCFMTGCGVVLLLLAIMCVGSYYVTMHSSLPLSFIEQAIESEGNVEIDGLRGSISSGFEMDSLKFDSDHNGPKSELRNIKFDYNGFVDMARSRRLIIREASVDGATIYARFDENGELELPGDFNGEEIAGELREEIEEMKDELENSDTEELEELRIDLVSGKNIEIVDPETDTRLKFNRVEFRNFKMVRGRVVRLGDLKVESDQLDLDTGESTRFAGAETAWNLTGTLRPVVYRYLIREMPFDIDFALDEDGHRLYLKLFDGRVEMDNPHNEQRVFLLNDFSPGDYFETESKLVASHWNVSLQVERQESPDQPADEESTDGEATDGEAAEGEAKPAPGSRDGARNRVDLIRIAAGGTFQLGETRFAIETEEVTFGPGEQMQPGLILATATLDGQPVTARISLRDSAPFHSIELVESGLPPGDLWARLFYDKPYTELDAGQQQEVDRALQAAAPGDFQPVEF